MLPLTIALLAVAADVPLKEWMERPGVRLVAVQSVPEKCEGCIKEAPRWDAFAKKYRSRGLRVISVVARDPMFGCIDPGWKPDEIVCDIFYDGIAKKWRLRERAPTALLWSWKGELLVERSDVATVEAAVLRQLGSTPQLIVDVREGKRERLREELREAIIGSNKYQPSSPATERARIEALGRGTYAAIHLGLPKCDVGRGLGSDAILAVRVEGPRIDLALRSEEGCLLASISSSEGTSDAVSSLFAKIPRNVSLPKDPQPAEMGALDDPRSKKLTRAVEKYLGRTDITPQAMARALIQETAGIDIGETLPEQLDCGPEVPLDIREPDRTLEPGDLIFYVSYAYVPKVVLVYLGRGLVAEAADVRGVVVGPLPVELPYFFQTLARRPVGGVP